MDHSSSHSRAEENREIFEQLLEQSQSHGPLPSRLQQPESEPERSEEERRRILQEFFQSLLRRPEQQEQQQHEQLPQEQHTFPPQHQPPTLTTATATVAIEVDPNHILVPVGSSGASSPTSSTGSASVLEWNSEVSTSDAGSGELLELDSEDFMPTTEGTESGSDSEVEFGSVSDGSSAPVVISASASPTPSLPSPRGSPPPLVPMELSFTLPLAPIASASPGSAPGEAPADAPDPAPVPSRNSGSGSPPQQKISADADADTNYVGGQGLPPGFRAPNPDTWASLFGGLMPPAPIDNGISFGTVLHPGMGATGAGAGVGPISLPADDEDEDGEDGLNFIPAPLPGAVTLPSLSSLFPSHARQYGFNEFDEYNRPRAVAVSDLFPPVQQDPQVAMAQAAADLERDILTSVLGPMPDIGQSTARNEAESDFGVLAAAMEQDNLIAALNRQSNTPDFIGYTLPAHVPATNNKVDANAVAAANEQSNLQDALNRRPTTPNFTGYGMPDLVPAPQPKRHLNSQLEQQGPWRIFDTASDRDVRIFDKPVPDGIPVPQPNHHLRLNTESAATEAEKEQQDEPWRITGEAGSKVRLWLPDRDLYGDRDPNWMGWAAPQAVEEITSANWEGPKTMMEELNEAWAMAFEHRKLVAALNGEAAPSGGAPRYIPVEVAGRSGSSGGSKATTPAVSPCDAPTPAAAHPPTMEAASLRTPSPAPSSPSQSPLVASTLFKTPVGSSPGKPFLLTLLQSTHPDSDVPPTASTRTTSPFQHDAQQEIETEVISIAEYFQRKALSSNVEEGPATSAGTSIVSPTPRPAEHRLNLVEDVPSRPDSANSGLSYFTGPRSAPSSPVVNVNGNGNATLSSTAKLQPDANTTEEEEEHEQEGEGYNDLASSQESLLAGHEASLFAAFASGRVPPEPPSPALAASSVFFNEVEDHDRPFPTARPAGVADGYEPLATEPSPPTPVLFPVITGEGESEPELDGSFNCNPLLGRSMTISENPLTRTPEPRHRDVPVLITNCSGNGHITVPDLFQSVAAGLFGPRTPVSSDGERSPRSPVRRDVPVLETNCGRNGHITVPDMFQSVAAGLFGPRSALSSDGERSPRLPGYRPAYANTRNRPRVILPYSSREGSPESVRSLEYQESRASSPREEEERNTSQSGEEDAEGESESEGSVQLHRTSSFEYPRREIRSPQDVDYDYNHHSRLSSPFVPPMSPYTRTVGRMPSPYPPSSPAYSPPMHSPPRLPIVQEQEREVRQLQNDIIPDAESRTRSPSSDSAASDSESESEGEVEFPLTATRRSCVPVGNREGLSDAPISNVPTWLTAKRTSIAPSGGSGAGNGPQPQPRRLPPLPKDNGAAAAPYAVGTRVRISGKASIIPPMPPTSTPSPPPVPPLPSARAGVAPEGKAKATAEGTPKFAMRDDDEAEQTPRDDYYASAFPSSWITALPASVMKESRSPSPDYPPFPPARSPPFRPFPKAAAPLPPTVIIIPSRSPSPRSSCPPTPPRAPLLTATTSAHSQEAKSNDSDNGASEAPGAPSNSSAAQSQSYITNMTPSQRMSHFFNAPTSSLSSTGWGMNMNTARPSSDAGSGSSSTSGSLWARLPNPYGAGATPSSPSNQSILHHSRTEPPLAQPPWPPYPQRRLRFAPLPPTPGYGCGPPPVFPPYHPPTHPHAYPPVPPPPQYSQPLRSSYIYQTPVPPPPPPVIPPVVPAVPPPPPTVASSSSSSTVNSENLSSPTSYPSSKKYWFSDATVIFRVSSVSQLWLDLLADLVFSGRELLVQSS
ncbi:hypothetical protein CVT26_004672 [Gymnopilus dilepis]|uniref:Uncharacterized protein n=1 Tax=Gymnopilus dilepis TaxID=231916 RepID=A0A409YKL7_9AGAR|nr:hypothetical protein CVT26_004672 [Gymnopilus dilepis]